MLVLLLCGSDKGDQDRAMRQAIEFLADWIAADGSVVETVILEPARCGAWPLHLGAQGRCLSSGPARALTFGLTGSTLCRDVLPVASSSKPVRPGQWRPAIVADHQRLPELLHLVPVLAWLAVQRRADAGHQLEAGAAGAVGAGDLPCQGERPAPGRVALSERFQLQNLHFSCIVGSVGCLRSSHMARGCSTVGRVMFWQIPRQNGPKRQILSPVPGPTGDRIC